MSLAPVRSVMPWGAGRTFGFRHLRTECVYTATASAPSSLVGLVRYHSTASGRHCVWPARYFSSRRCLPLAIAYSASPGPWLSMATRPLSESVEAWP